MSARDRSADGAKRSARLSLGEFLRAQRDRLRPEDFQLPRGRRRAPGLRREEVAQLCAISPTWYTWIEQGRTTAISVATLNAIADGLRLSRAERAYLFEVSSRADPSPARREASDPRGPTALVRAIRAPAYVLDRHWDAIAWNPRAAELFVDWLGKGALKTSGPPPAHERNLLRYVFLDPRAPAFIADWQERSRRLVAEYRADTASAGEDPVREALVRELCEASAAFDAAWRSQRVLSREGGTRVFQHPARGRCRYEQYTLRPAQQCELMLTVLLSLDA